MTIRTCPASVKELYSYNPTKAKQLLSDAGFPNGFKTSVITGQTDTTVIDYYSTVKQMWAKVGVDLTIDVRDNGVWTSIYRARSYDQMVYGTYSPTTNLYQAASMWGNTMTNESYINDPKVDAARTQDAGIVPQRPGRSRQRPQGTDEICSRPGLGYSVSEPGFLRCSGSPGLRTTMAPGLAVSAT